jgi:hypothetical protein
MIFLGSRGYKKIHVSICGASKQGNAMEGATKA